MYYLQVLLLSSLQQRAYPNTNRLRGPPGRFLFCLRVMGYNKLMNNCNCKSKTCGHCHGRGCALCDPPCACPAPFLGIEQVPDNVSVLRFNIQGKRADYDYTNLVYQTQSDTVLVADAVNRLLNYQAERHADTITARELGAILHLADIGDVDSKGAETGSFLTYQKDSNCGDGCIGLHDSWKVWNALDESVSSATFPMAFDANGRPVTIRKPASPNKQYLLGWDRQNQLSYITPAKVTSKPATGGALYYDEASGEIVIVEGA